MNGCHCGALDDEPCAYVGGCTRDYATAERQAFIAHIQSNDFKRAQALAYLGPKWLLHPANAVQRKTART